MANTTLEDLYRLMTEIQENKKNGKGSENEQLFASIVAASKGDALAKRLASQFIARLFKDFPQQQKAAYEAMIDMIEDDDVMIRKQVVSDLPKLCKDAVEFTPKVADILVQMLATDDAQEQTLVNQALMQTISGNPLEALRGVFGQLQHDEVADASRERVVKLLAGRLHHVQLSPRVEEFVVDQVTQALEDVSEEEFVSFVQLLAGLQCMQTLVGRQKLVNMICDQADFEAEFVATDASCVARVRQCANQAAPYLSKNITAKQFVVYFLDKVIPAIDSVTADADGENPRLDLLKAFAEVSAHAGPKFAATDAQLQQLLERLLSLMPPSPAPADAEATEAGDQVQIDLNFSEVECLLFAFHQLGRSNKAFLADNDARLQEFKRRLQQFHRANQLYLQSLRTSSQQQQQQQQQQATEDDTARGLRNAALIITNNINCLIRDLFKSPPAYRAEVQLSWRHHQHQQQQQQHGSDRKRRGDLDSNGDDAAGGGGGKRRDVGGRSRSRRGGRRW